MLRKTENPNQFIFTHEVEVAGKLTGFVTVPTGFDPAKESLPVILFLHGAGERGTNLELVKVHGIGKLFAADPDYHGLRVITLSPQCPNGMVWNHLTFPLREWLMKAVEELGADKSNIAVTGLSMGGYGTWDMITTFPELFSKAAPICGAGMAWRAGALANKPIRVFHGTADGSVDFRNSEEMVRAAKNRGAIVEFTEYEGVGHNSWNPAYEQTDLIEWLTCKVTDAD